MAPVSQPEDRSQLQQLWSALYADELPRLAKARDKAQSKWPVVLDHCFARIILDNAVGRDKPWMERVGTPAVKKMSEQQLQAALSLGRKIANGEANLDELNQRSLELRGKGGPKRKHAESGGEPSPRGVKKPKTASETEDIRSHFFGDGPRTESTKTAPPTLEILQARDTIASSNDLTPFRRFALILLTYIPRGRYSTYGAMGSYITANHHKCSARAIGNAMRNNPFAPTVPCHRVLAHDGRIGGFGGDWGEEGKHAAEKRRLLATEGVKFDSRGKVVGKPFTGFQDDAEVAIWYEQILGGTSK
ncbi:hypothetical protein SLS58_002042 [Diplodia intermedia]|uniref:Methylated-DNA--protein-cysteine methyltransferase n=1 Tax=Diplodia intermedia TaxID=856260 RepID=A0ABR3U0L4_9PEZI